MANTANVVEDLISRLKNVKAHCDHQHTTSCPVHDDEHPSLSIKVTDDGTILLKCHAGCLTDDIMKAIGLELKDLFPDKDDAKVRDLEARIVTTYQYTDESGTLLFETVRLRDPKDFRQRRSDGSGGWVWDLKGVRRVLYLLHEVIAADKDTVIFKTEGEKDTDRLRAFGMVATTNLLSAGKWHLVDDEPLRDRPVVVLVDNDDSGRKYALQVATALFSKAVKVRLLELQGLPPKGDVSDWLEAGGTVEQLLLLAESAPVFEPKPEDIEAVRLQRSWPCTDLGNSERFTEQHRDTVHFCHPWKSGLVWDGRRWRKDDTAEVERLAKTTVRSIYGEVAAIDDSKERKAMAAHAKSSEAKYRIKALLTLAESEPGIPVTPDQLNVDPWLLNCLNGTIDLRTGELRPHGRADLITQLAPVDYDPDAEFAIWDDCLAHVTDADAELLGFLQRAIGYSITGDTGEEKLFFPHGEYGCRQVYLH